MESSLIRIVLDCGADRAAYLPGSAVVTDPVFRGICERNACGKYGRSYMCPPDVGGIGELIARVRGYPDAVLYQTVGILEDSFDFEGMMQAGHVHNLCGQRIRRALEERAVSCLHLTGGGCSLCDRCAKIDELPCRHPREALAPLESYGIDVYRTCQAAGLPYSHGENTVTYFGIILFDGRETL